MKRVLKAEIVLGIGIGIVIACILLLPTNKKKPSPMEIETMARQMGMVYEDEIRAIPNLEKGE